MEVIYSSEISVVFQCITWRYIPEDRTLDNQLSEKVNSCKMLRILTVYELQHIHKKSQVINMWIKSSLQHLNKCEANGCLLAPMISNTECRKLCGHSHQT
jgi:hypothetical protein